MELYVFFSVQKARVHLADLQYVRFSLFPIKKHIFKYRIYCISWRSGHALIY